MLYNVKLSDFSLEMIDYLLRVMEDQLRTQENNLLMVELWDDSQIKEIKQKQYTDLYDKAMLFKIQLLNAKKDIEQLAHSN